MIKSMILVNLVVFAYASNAPNNVTNNVTNNATNNATNVTLLDNTTQASPPGSPPNSPPSPVETADWEPWEIALASGSGGVSVLLLMYAISMRRRKEPNDIEIGKPDSKTRARTADVPIITKDAKRNGAKPTDVNPKSMAVKTKSMDKSKSMAVKTKSMDNPKSMAVKTKSMDVKPKSMAVKPKSMDAKSKTMDAKSKTMDVKPKSIDARAMDAVKNGATAVANGAMNGVAAITTVRPRV